MADSNWREFAEKSLEQSIAECAECGARELSLSSGDDIEFFDECLNFVAQRLPDVQHLHVSLENEPSAALFCRRAAEFPNLHTLDLICSGEDDVLQTLTNQTTILPLIRSIALNVGDDGLKAIASQAEHFSGLKEILIVVCDISNEGVRSLADQARHFVNLEEFADGDEDIDPQICADGSMALLSFTQLKRLEVGSGRWSIGDEWLEALAKRGNEFTRLTTLEVARTAVGDKGVEVLAKHGKRFASLHTLNLTENKVGDAGAKALADNAQNFGTLESLHLADTNISDEGLKALALAWQRGNFDRLRHLGLNDRSFDALEWMIENGEFGPLDPEEWPPRISIVAPEVLRTGDAKHIFQAAIDGLALPEAKLVVLGEPGVGKTSLCRRLFHNEPVDPSLRQETHDFELIIPAWRPEVKGRDVQLRVWDFGGQHVLHGTHEMFLTSRSVCLLVLDATQVAEHDRGVVDEERDGNRLTYWLKMIRHFVGQDAHIILVVTKNDESTVRLPPINAEGHRARHDFIRPIRLVQEFSATDKSHEAAVEDLQREIQNSLELLELPRVSRQFAALKEHLEHKMEDRAFVRLEEYRQWCHDVGVKKHSDQDAHLRTLHHFGGVFYFGLLDCDRKQLEERRSRRRSRLSDDLAPGQHRLLKAERDPILQRWLINPRWLKRPLYQLIRQSNGQQWLSGDEIRKAARRKTQQTAMDDPSAAEDVVLAVLKLTELCFYDREHGKYFFPRGLPRDGGRFLTGWDEASRHEIRWEWEFFPETVIHRFIVRAHENGEISVRTQWRTGVVLERGDTMVAIQGEPEHGLVKVWLKKRPDNAERPTRGDRDFLDQIRHHLRELVGREPGEETRSWEEAATGATDVDGQEYVSKTQEHQEDGPVKQSAVTGNTRQARRKTGRPKKSEKDSETKVVAALSKHHGYEPGGSVSNYEPAKNRDLAKEFDLSGNALSRFLTDKLGPGGGKTYKNRCSQGKIGALLVIWNRELPSRDPPIRDDE